MNFGTLNNYNDICRLYYEKGENRFENSQQRMNWLQLDKTDDALDFQIDNDNDADLQVKNDLKSTRTTV